jgi:hypothetical protein
MGMWPSRARATVDAVTGPLKAAETFPAASNVYQITTGTPVPVWGVGEAPVPRDLALTVPGVLRGTVLISTTIAGLEIERITATGTRAPLGWLEQPEASRPRFNTLIDIVNDLQFDGRSYLRVHERVGTAPRVGGCEYVALSRVGDPKGLLPHGSNYADYPITIDGIPVPASELLAFQGWHAGIRYHGARLIRTALALEAAARRYADVPMAPVTLVNESGYDMSDAEIDKLLADYKRGRNAEGVGYTQNVKPVVTGLNSMEMQLVEARQFISTQIANLIGLPANAIAGAAAASGGAVTYQNVTQESRSLIDYGLKTPLTTLESRLSMSDVSGADTIRFLLDSLLRGDALQRAQLYQILVPLGILTISEARAMEDLTPEGKAST